MCAGGPRRSSQAAAARGGRQVRRGGIYLVTHKGWLREFEHGALGRPHAAEFGNCELRIFEFEISAGEICVRRLHPREDVTWTRS